MKLQNVFRRVSQGSRTADTTDGAEDKKLGQLFGRSLCDLCGGDGQTNLPQPVVVSRRKALSTLRDLLLDHNNFSRPC